MEDAHECVWLGIHAARGHSIIEKTSDVANGYIEDVHLWMLLDMCSARRLLIIEIEHRDAPQNSRGKRAGRVVRKGVELLGEFGMP
jgi:hypothetical protein